MYSREIATVAAPAVVADPPPFVATPPGAGAIQMNGAGLTTDTQEGVANARLAYQHYEGVFGGDRWKALEAAGAKPPPSTTAAREAAKSVDVSPGVP